MAKFHNNIKLGAPPDKAWAVVGDLAGVDRWIPGCTNVKIEGDVRICSFADGAVQHEEIRDYSNKRRSYRYSISGGPLPLKSNRGRWAVQADGKGSKIVWDAEVEVLDPSQEKQITQMLDGAYKQVIQLLGKLIQES